MKKIIILCLSILILSSSYAFARDYTAKSRYLDLNPNDGIFDKGTWQNPYVIEDQRGREVGTMKPKYLDIEPNDGLFDAGTWQNPYVIETD